MLLTAGRSTVLMTEFDITRLAVTNPAVADAVVVKPREVLVDGKGSGTVSLIVWGATERKHYDIVVDPGVTHAAAELPGPVPRRGHQRRGDQRRRDPVGRGVEQRGHAAQRRARQRGDAEACRDQHAAAAQRLAEQAGDAAGPLRRSEPQRAAAVGADAVLDPRRRHRPHQHTAVRRARFRSQGDVDLLQFSDFLNVFLFSREQGIGGVLKALQTRGFLQSLAEPNLIAYNGEEASFLAGGEIPIPLVTGLGQTSMSLQGIRHPPHVPADDRRRRDPPEAEARGQHARLHQRHRAPGFRIPALNTRRAETDVELRDGQSFAIAGLLNNLTQTDRQAIPLLSRLPIIGTLFKSRSLRADQTELMVLVTPRLVRALDPDEVPAMPVRPGAFLNPSDEENRAYPATRPTSRPGLDATPAAGHQEAAPPARSQAAGQHPPARERDGPAD